MFRRILLLGLIPVAAVAFLVMEVPMASGKVVTLFSEINGTLVNGSGSPQSGIRIERWWRYGTEGDGESDMATTGQDGSFFFPAITQDSTWAGILPGTPSIKQRITAHGPNGDVKLWFAVKNSFDANSETGGAPANVICRIDQEPNADGPVFGTCRLAD
ncbi:MAG: DUF6795 domain-containing protein [Pseudomonadota bacterium]